MSCPLCDRELALKQNTYPYLIKEFRHSWWLVGDHQFYPGYTVLLLKGHSREMSDLEPEVAKEVFGELMLAHKAVESVYRPHKMNLHSLGNVVDHIHWHLFPRYADDPYRLKPVWLQMDEFATKSISGAEALPIAEKLRAGLGSL